MRPNHTRSRALMTTIAAAVCAASAAAAQPAQAPAGSHRQESRMSDSPSKPAWSLCGPGSYEMSAAGTPVGSETFDVTCAPDGRYTATGRTRMSAGTAIDLTTTLELTSDLQPASVVVKGTVGGQPFDQSTSFANGTATMTASGRQQSVPYTAGASWLGNNIFFTNAFIAARYDDAKGGVQQIPIFPAMSVSIERKATDTPALDGGERASFTRYVMRVATQEIVLWRDAQERLAVMAVPVQQFIVARPESAKWVRALLAGLQSSSGATPPADAVDYSAPAGAPFVATEVKIPVASYSLAGTLLVPKGGKRPYPAIVMVTGSGLQTRDSRLPIPGLEQYAPFRQIAERLAANGVAVLRVDDRGIGESTGRETLENATTSSLAEDTRAQVAWLRSRAEIDGRRIFIVGHSEGASIAAMVAASDPGVAGIVMMAGAGKSGAETAIEQHEDLLRSDATMTEEMKASLRAQQREAVKTILAGGDLPGQKTNAWTREYFASDPLATIRTVKQPILILQGELDRQVDRSHAALLADAARAAGNRDVSITVFPALNHLFLPSKTGSVSEYSRLETNAVPDAVLDAVVKWVRARGRVA